MTRLCFKNNTFLLKLFLFVSIVAIITHSLVFFKESSSSSDASSVYYIKSQCACRSDLINVHAVNRDLVDRSTCDVFNVLRRGAQQKVVSYSLYGSNPIYYNEIKYLVKQVTKYFPGWIIRIHYDSTVNRSIICEFECLKDEQSGKYVDLIDFCNITEIPYGSPYRKWSAEYLHSMAWRFMPIGDPFVDMFMSRDLDSWFIDREVEAVRVWLNSSTLFHVMRDHPQHGVPMLGGMWSYANYRNRELGYSLMSSLLRNVTLGAVYKVDNQKGKDQDFLGEQFWPIAKTNATVHDSFHCDKFGSALPFPSQRLKIFCFVPCVHCCDERVYNKTWEDECPEKCRPTEHKDWKYC